MIIPICAGIAALFGVLIRATRETPTPPEIVENTPVLEVSFRDRVLAGSCPEISHNAVYNALYQARKEITKTGLGGWLTAVLSQCEEMDEGVALTAIALTRKDAEKWGKLPFVEKALTDAERKIMEAGE